MKALKRVICLSVIALQIILCSCNKNPADNLPKQIIPEQIEILENAIASAPEGEYNTSLGTVWDADCPYFEERLQYFTDIVKATYRTSKQINRHYAHIFEVRESLRGEIKEQIIYVWAYNENRDGHDDSNKIEYKEGEKYLLLLERHSDPFLSFDTFVSIHPTLYIPLNYEWEPDIVASRICHSELVSFLKDEKLKQACVSGQFIPYIQQIAQKNPTKKFLKGFTETYDKEFAIQNAEYVLQIDVSSEMIGEVMPFSLDPHIQLYEVPIKEENILNGDKETLSDVVAVYLPVTIAEGSYIVAVNNSQDPPSRPRYVPSTRNSIYSVSERQEIIDFLKNGE